MNRVLGIYLLSIMVCLTSCSSEETISKDKETATEVKSVEIKFRAGKMLS